MGVDDPSGIGVEQLRRQALHVARQDDDVCLRVAASPEDRVI